MAIKHTHQQCINNCATYQSFSIIRVVSESSLYGKGREVRASLHVSGGLFVDVREENAPEVADEAVSCLELEAVVARALDEMQTGHAEDQRLRRQRGVVRRRGARRSGGLLFPGRVVQDRRLPGHRID